MNLTDEQREQRNRLKSWMKAKGIDRQSFADKLGYKIGYIEQVLSGKNAISENLEWRLRKYYPELSIDWLMLGDGEMELAKHDQELFSLEEGYSTDHGQPLDELKRIIRNYELRIAELEKESVRLLEELRLKKQTYERLKYIYEKLVEDNFQK